MATFDRRAAKEAGYSDEEIDEFIRNDPDLGPLAKGGGMVPEIAKGAARGLLGIPNVVREGGDWLERKFPTPDWSKIGDQGFGRVLDDVNARLEATPANNNERMAGTAAEIFTPGALLNKVKGLTKRFVAGAVPAAGGVAGEQLGGDTGKMIGTLAAPFAQGGASRLLNPRVSQEAKDLVAKGVDVPPGALLGEPFKSIERWPIVRSFSSPAQHQAERQWQKSQFNEILQPIGAKVDDIGHAGYRQAEKFGIDAYDAALKGAKNFYWTKAFDSDLNSAIGGVKTQYARDKVEEIVRSINRFNKGDTPIWSGAPTANGLKVTPKNWKKIDSDIGDAIRKYEGKSSEDAEFIVEGLHNVQKALRGHMAVQNPANAPALERANKVWAGLMSIQDAVAKSAIKGGEFTPESLMATIQRRAPFDSTVARGNAPLQQSTLGAQKTLGDAQNPALGGAGLMMGAIGASTAHPYGWLPAAVMGGLGAAYSKPMRGVWPKVLGGSRPPWAQAAGQAMAPNSAFGGVPGALPELSEWFSR